MSISVATFHSLELYHILSWKSFNFTNDIFTQMGLNFEDILFILVVKMNNFASVRTRFTITGSKFLAFVYLFLSNDFSVNF